MFWKGSDIQFIQSIKFSAILSGPSDQGEIRSAGSFKMTKNDQKCKNNLFWLIFAHVCSFLLIFALFFFGGSFLLISAHFCLQYIFMYWAPGSFLLIFVLFCFFLLFFVFFVFVLLCFVVFCCCLLFVCVVFVYFLLINVAHEKKSFGSKPPWSDGPLRIAEIRDFVYV